MAARAKPVDERLERGGFATSEITAPPVEPEPPPALVTDRDGRIRALATFTTSGPTGAPMRVAKGGAYGGAEAVRLAALHPDLFEPFSPRVAP